MTDRNFLVPTIALAVATAALGTAVGFLPALARDHGVPVLVATATVTLLAVVSAVVQPVVGKLIDAGTITTKIGVPFGLMLIAVALLTAAFVPLMFSLFLAAALLGVGIGVVTPLGFATLASTTPENRVGQVMGSAELGRETGDAAGPLLVGAIASAAGLPLGLGALGVIALAATVVTGRFRPRRAQPSGASGTQ